MSSVQAAARLGVSATTLYSYVSRGLLHPLPASEVARENDPHGVATAQDLHGVKGSSRAKFYRRISSYNNDGSVFVFHVNLRS